MNQENIPASVFLSYAHKNLSIAIRLEQDLWEKKIPVWRDERNMKPGDDWDQKIRDAIASSCAVIYLATPDARASRVVRAELALAAMYKKPVYLLWREGKAWVDVVPLDYYPDQHIDIREQYYQNGLQRLLTYLERLTFAANQPHTPGGPGKDPNMSTPGSPLQEPSVTAPLMTRPSLLERIFKRKHDTDNAFEQKARRSPQTRQDPGRNPYKGLQAFTTRDANDFFGREELVNTMISELKHILRREHIESQEPRFLTIVGPSGSGKSSAVMAGLLPRLQKGAHVPPGTKSSPIEYVPGSDRWIYLFMRPGTDPVRTLAATLIPLLPVEDRKMETVLTNLQDENTRALHLYAATDIAAEAGKRVVLVVDQFEELFTESTEESRQQFIDLLAIAATEPENKVIVVITLRADFSDQVMKSSLPYRMIEAHRIPIPPMTVENLRAVIEKPARSPGVGVRFEANLIGELLLDIRGREENLPLLQFTLDKLFQERRQHDNTLTLEAYYALGRVYGALSKHAKETYENLPSDEHRQLAEKLFIRLINPGGVEQDATRRRVAKAAFTYDDPQQNRQMQETITAFIDARLLTANEVTTGKLGEHTIERIPTYEISHEALISEWQQLRDWISKAREDILTQQNMDTTIEQWQRQKKAARRLYRGEQLIEVLAWSRRNSPNKIEKQFIKTSIRHQRNRRILWGIPSIAILCALFYSIVLPIANLVIPYFISTIVTNFYDSGNGSLRQAIAQAKAGTTITFDPALAGKTILLNSNNLQINKDLVIRGPIGNIKISSRTTGNFITITFGHNVTFENVTFADSYTHKNTFITNYGNLTLNDCLVVNNKSYGNGGAIMNGDHLILNNTFLSGNTDSGNGGAIYNLFGIMNINGSTITSNHAYNNGGGIYSIGGDLEILNSQVTLNTVADPATVVDYGGGIDIVDGSLYMSGTKVSKNVSQYYGGGIAIQGSVAFITDTTIDKNGASAKGGGIIVAINTDNNFSSLVTLRNITVTDKPDARYYIGQNTSQNSREKDIAGVQKPVGPILQIASNDEKVGIAGNPPPGPATPGAANLLGVANLAAFCQDEGYSDGQISPDANNANPPDIRIQCATSESTQTQDFPGNQVCQEQFHSSLPTGVNATDRIVNYHDPLTLECYKNLKFLGPIGQNLADFDTACKSVSQNTGLYDNRSERTTAYDWKCQPKDNHYLPRGLSVAIACQLKYKNKNAFDRLVDYNIPAGWECFAPA